MLSYFKHEMKQDLNLGEQQLEEKVINLRPWTKEVPNKTRNKHEDTYSKQLLVWLNEICIPFQTSFHPNKNV